MHSWQVSFGYIVGPNVDVKISILHSKVGSCQFVNNPNIRLFWSNDPEHFNDVKSKVTKVVFVEYLYKRDWKTNFCPLLTTATISTIYLHLQIYIPGVHKRAD